jgi:hypothetical protein
MRNREFDSEGRRNNTTQKRDISNMPYLDHIKLWLAHLDRNRFEGHPLILR